MCKLLLLSTFALIADDAFADSLSTGTVEFHSCDPEADFLVFDQTGCRAAVFGPTFLNPEGYSYSWDFGELGVPNPNLTGRVQNYEYTTGGTYDITLTVTFPDKSTYTCTQSFTVDCSDPCDDLTDFSFAVDANDCFKYTFTPLPLPPGVSMADLGDIWWHRWLIDGVLLTDANGDPIEDEVLCYTFPEDGEYEVTHWMEFDGVTFFNCTQTVTVDCDPDDCTTADFEIKAGTTCSASILFHVAPDCTDPAFSHLWTVSSNGVTLASSTDTYFNPSDAFINFSTYLNPVITVSHTLFDAAGNQVGATETETFDFAANNIEGIFIGGFDAGGNPLTVSSSTLNANGLFDFIVVNEGLTWQNRNIFISGILEVDEPTSFVGCDVTIASKSGVDVLSDRDNKITVQANTYIHGTCDCLWRSIRLFSETQFVGNRARVEDGLYALEPAGGGGTRPRIDLKDVQFSENFIGIKSADFIADGVLYSDNQFQQGKWNSVFFDNSRKIYELCGMDNTIEVDDGDGNPDNNVYRHETANGLAGIFLRDLTFQAINEETVFFNSITNGIIIDNSSVLMSEMNFHNIVSVAEYGEESGTGVRFLDAAGGNVIEYTGGGFTNCRNGISVSTAALGTEAYISNMTMSNVAGGVTGNDNNDGTGNGQFARFEVTDCNINSNDNNLQQITENNHGVGVFTTQTTFSSNFFIAGNVIDVTQNNLNDGGAAGIILESSPLTDNVLRCENNTVNVGNANSGIQMSNWHGAPDINVKGSQVFDNDIHLSNYSDFHQGIRIENSRDNHFICNDVFGVNSGFGNGIVLIGSPLIELAGNTMTDVQIDLEVQGICSDADIRFNQFLGQAFRGVQYTANVVTSNQINRGNIWNLTNANPNNPNDFTNAFHAATSQNTINMSQYFTGVAINNVGTNCGVSCPWFITSGNTPALPTCETMLTDNLTPQGFTGGGTETDKKIAQSNSESEYLNWHSQRDLYRKMQSWELIEDADLAEFHSLNSNNKIGQYYSANQAIKEAVKLAQDDLEEIESLTQLRLELLQDITDIEGVIAESIDEDTEDLLTERAELQVEIKSNLFALQEVFAAVRSVQTENILTVLPQISALPNETDFAANEKILLNIFADMVAENHRLPTAAQRLHIKEIAEQCVNEGGEVVYWARGWYNSLTKTDDLNISEDCSIDYSEEAEERNTVAEKSDFSVFPNPSSETINITLSPGTDISEKVIEIYDFTGKKVVTLPVGIREIHTIDVSDFSNGIYRLVYRENGNLVDYESVIILH